MDADIDPYVYPGTYVLKNLAGLESVVGANEYERGMSLFRRRELELTPIKGSFDLAHLQEIHRTLYQDVWEWAGQLRTVDITKGYSDFHPHTKIHVGFQDVERFLAGSSLLKPDCEEETFVMEAAELLEMVNYIHPFREGNGRTQRAYLDQIAAVSGRTLSWRNVSAMENERASIQAFHAASGKPLRAIIRRSLEPPMDGLTLLDEALYTVNTEPVAPKRPRRTHRDRLAEISAHTATLREAEPDPSLEL